MFRFWPSFVVSALAPRSFPPCKDGSEVGVVRGTALAPHRRGWRSCVQQRWRRRRSLPPLRGQREGFASQEGLSLRHEVFWRRRPLAPPLPRKGGGSRPARVARSRFISTIPSHLLSTSSLPCLAANAPPPGGLDFSGAGIARLVLPFRSWNNPRGARDAGSLRTRGPRRLATPRLAEVCSAASPPVAPASRARCLRLTPVKDQYVH